MTSKFNDRFIEKEVSLHSEKIPVIERIVNNKAFCLAAPNGRCRVWSERFFEIEPEFIDFVSLFKENDIFWDIGCSISHFTIFATLASGCKAYGFEPESQNFSVSSLNHYLNYKELNGNYTPLNFGISNKSSLETMNIHLFGAGEHTKSLIPLNSKTTYSTKVLMLSLTETLKLGITPPSIIKIDVDGSEKIVVDAIIQLLEKVRLVFIEINKKDFSYFEEIFKKNGFLIKSQHNIVKMNGGFYDDIVNVIFERASYGY